ncbi:MAG TPA: hypothetical protein VFB58_08520 [Chloroflexota bacterium]|nr:hypothetical protein [Chloroflexota bacterium]
MAFVFGLLVGPALGLIVGVVAVRRALGPWLGLSVLGLVGLFILFVPLISLDLKLGLITGMAAGALLSVTPLTIGTGPTT